MKAPPPLNQAQPHRPSQRPRSKPLARTRRCRSAIPGQLRIPRRTLPGRNRDQALSAALWRLRSRLGLRHLPSQPRRLSRLVPSNRNTRRHRRGSPRLRLRALPQRPLRVDARYTDELTRGTTSSQRRLSTFRRALLDRHRKNVPRASHSGVIVNYLLSLSWWNGGRYRARTDDLYGVNVALCQLS